MPKHFKGYVIPDEAFENFHEVIRAFQSPEEPERGCLMIEARKQDPSIPDQCTDCFCTNCLMSSDNKKVFSEYICSDVCRDLVKDRDRRNEIVFTALSTNILVVRFVVDGWMSGLCESYPALAGAFAVRRLGYETTVSVDVEYLRMRGMRFSWLYERFKELYKALKQINGFFRSDGRITWFEQGGTVEYDLIAQGTELTTTKIGPTPVVKEMTVDEISKKLGHPVKVIGEKDHD